MRLIKDRILWNNYFKRPGDRLSEMKVTIIKQVLELDESYRNKENQYIPDDVIPLIGCMNKSHSGWSPRVKLFNI